MVTRTVTYCRTPLEPAPRGKRRKLDTNIPDASAASIAETPITAIEHKPAAQKLEEPVAEIKTEHQDGEPIIAAITISEAIN